MLWFDVSTVRPATSTPLRSLEPVSAGLLQKAAEAPSASVSPSAAFHSTVTEYQELQESLSRSTGPSSHELPQDVVVSSSTVAAESHKTFVLEEKSMTNRKGPAQSELDSSTKLGDTMPKVTTKTPIAPGTLDANSKLEPVDLTIMGEPEKTEASIDRHTSEHHHRSSSALAGYALAGFGGLSLILSVVFTSTVLAFIGLGLVFWGALLLFIRPRRYVRSDLMDSTALSSLTTIDRMITSLGYTQKGVYIPMNNPGKAVVFIPSKPLKKIPKIELVENQTFVKDPEGIAMVPPGLSLANLFERELGVKFTDWSLQEMSERLPKLLIEDLELVQDCTIKFDGDRVSFRFAESVYAEFCSKLRDSTQVCSTVGCPLCSAMACVLAQVSHRPVEFDEDKYSTDGGTVESSYHILAG